MLTFSLVNEQGGGCRGGFHSVMRTLGYVKPVAELETYFFMGAHDIICFVNNFFSPFFIFVGWLVWR